MATNTRQSGADRIPVHCSCGKKLLALSEHAGKQVKCPACGEPVAVPASSVQPPARPASNNAVEDVVEGFSRNTLIAMWSLVGVFAVGSVTFVLWYNHSTKQANIAAANERISIALADANKWIGGDSALDGEVVEQQLVRTLEDESATNKADGESVLGSVRQRREELTEQARVQRAKEQAASLFAEAKRHIQAKRVAEAIVVLREYVGDAYATEKTEGQRLLNEAEVVVADELTRETLLGLDDAAFEAVKSGRQIGDGKVTHPVLLAVREETISRHLEEVTKRREEIKLAEQKKRESERLAQERRVEEMRLAEAERRQQDEARRRTERARLAELASAGLLDIADDPQKYVGMSFTRLVWISGSFIEPVKQKNNDGRVVIDGYLLVFSPGERDPNDADNVGNPYGVAADKLYPFLSAKEVARKLQDIIQSGFYRKFKVTFTVKAVVLNEWPSLGKRDTTYLAVVSNVQEP